MTPEPTDDPRDGPTGKPEFDARRSAEIRALLVRTVTGTPRARPARLSRPAFALAATAALLFAGGAGAGTVLAIDRFAEPLVAQDASGAPQPVEAASTLSGEAASADGQDAAATQGATESDLFEPKSDTLTPVVTINGETGYAYPRDIDLARANGFLGATADVADAVPAGQIPIYLADGVTLLGYFDPASLLP